MCRRSLSILFVALLASSPVLAQPAPVTFTLNTVDGAQWSLDDCKSKAVVVLFLGTQCPINNAYMPKLIEMEKEYRGRGVQFVAINANQHDKIERIREHAKKHKVPFPVLRDEKQTVAERFGVERHPTAYVLDTKRVVRYEGRIDDQFGIGYARPAPTRRDLAEAIDEVLAGKEVTKAKTPVEGCFLTKLPAAKAATTDVTFTKDVSRILQNRCQECHRAGQIGPMPLMTYSDVSSWAKMIKEVVSEDRMPPWHADPKHGKFKNDRRLSPDERAKLLAWIDAGCPEGQAGDMPAARKFAEGWSIGQPDVVYTMPNAYTIPAKAPKGGIPYKYVVIPTNFDEDKWIQAVETKPGNYEVVHHIIVYIVQGGKRVRDAADGIGSGLLVAYAPGDLGSVFPPGAAKKLPKGASLAFQMHYTPNGVEQTDKSSIGLVFAKEPVKQEIRTRAVAQQLFAIPPNEANHKVVSKTTFAKDALLYSMFPHMHLRGKSFQFEAIYPDSKREVLLSVPHYDFGWQSNYLLEKPLLMPAGTRIECTAYFDNSVKNPNNPDPSRIVIWGEQTWHEMMIGFLDYSYVEDAVGKK